MTSSKVDGILGKRKLFTAVLIALLALAYVVYSSLQKAANFDDFSELDWTGRCIPYLGVAIILIIIRDFGYMIRLKALSKNKLSWKQSFRVTILWEFASAMTPSVVGGSGIAMFIINREGINMGKSTAIVMITALLDELFYIVMVPTIILILGYSATFENLAYFVPFFIAGYIFILALTSIIFSGVFWKPELPSKILVWFTKFRWFSRWKIQAQATGQQIIDASKEFKSKPAKFWVKPILSTIFSWTARFLLVNALIAAFVPISFGQHVLVFGRQLIMWVVMLISPTPGSSGVAEIAFESFIGSATNLSPLLLAGIIVLWRLSTFFPYIIAGMIILPGWLIKTGTNDK